MKVLTVVFILLSGAAFGQKLPELNNKIVVYLDEVMGTQVDRGECWDLAAGALDASGAYFDKSSLKTIYEFGQEYNPDKQDILPGDIIQFKNVTLKYHKDNVEYKETMAHHTAIVYKVIGKNHLVLAHQNTSFSGKKVATSELRLEDVSKGKLSFFRPYTK